MGIGIDIKGVGEILGGAGKLAKDIRTAVTGKDPEKMAELALRAQEIESALQTAQTEVNKVEASSGSLFVAGWRPAVGWICVAGLGYAVILEPLAEFIARLLGYSGAFPDLNAEVLNTTLWGMLGLGAMRSAEKITGAAGKH